MTKMHLRAFATTLAGLALMGCEPAATPETIADVQKGTPAPGSYTEAVPASLTRTTQAQVDLKAAARAANAFGLDLHQRLAAPGNNVVWSPYSVATVLGMGLAGARGTTASEMAKVLHAAEAGGDATALAQSLGMHQRLLGERAGADNTLRIANAIWGAPQARFVPDYVLTIGAAYGGGLHRIDYSDPERARGVINGWVSDHTERLIPELIPEGAVTPATRAVLCNALYFKGTWAHQFKPADTQPRAFHTETDGAVAAPTMYRNGKCRLRSMEGADVAAMPYEGDKLSMVVILPNKPDGLRELEQSLTATRLGEWIDEVLGASMINKVQIWMPKWKARTTEDLVPTLKALGMQAAFDAGTADFSGMLEEAKIHVSQVLHEAVIEVNEEGTEAAAATAMVMKAGGPPKSNRFDVSHPFLYAIVEHRTRAILFLGRCADPTK